MLGADDEVGAVGPRVAARDGVREVGQHARRLPRLLAMASLMLRAPGRAERERGCGN